MPIWVKDKGEEWHEFEYGETVQVTQPDGVLTVMGPKPDNVSLAGFTGWTSWTSVDPDKVVVHAKGKVKAK